MNQQHAHIVAFFSCVVGSRNVLCQMDNGTFVYFNKGDGTSSHVSTIYKTLADLEGRKRFSCAPPPWYVHGLLRVSSGL